MRDRSIVPTNLLDWPRVANLLPELKLILGLGLWAGRYTNCIGIAAVPLRPLAASLGLEAAALESGLQMLCHGQLLVGDWDRYEFFIVDWFRFHYFKGAGVSIAMKEYQKIGSALIRHEVLKAAPWLADIKVGAPIIASATINQRVSSPTATAAANSIASSAHKVRIRRESGIVTFLPIDPPRAEEIESTHSDDLISAAVAAIENQLKEPVPGLVLKEIERRKKSNAREKAQNEKQMMANSITSTPEGINKGLTELWTAIDKKPPREKQCVK